MIQCHALSLLRPELRQGGPLFNALVWLDGLVAPSFIFSAGFSLALVQVRTAATGPRLWRVLKTLRRLGEVIGVGLLGVWMFFPVRAEPKWLLRVDILQCIGYSLLVALPLTAAFARRPRVLQWVALALAAAAFGIAPFAESASGLLGNLINSHTEVKSMFPLLPWAGYVYLGASAGAIAATGNVGRLVRWIVAIGLTGLVVWKLGPWLLHVYPPHEYWVTNPANHAERWLVVCCLVLVLLALELRVPGTWRESAPVRFVQVFGMSSLAAYFLHEMLLYYRIFGFSFYAVWGDRCGWVKYAGLASLLIASAFVLTWTTDKVYRRMGVLYDQAVAALRMRWKGGAAQPAASTSQP
jgi:uncharacterized membrane protein